MDWTLEELIDIRAKDIEEYYGCPLPESEEAMVYVSQFITDMTALTDQECAAQYQQMLKDEFGVNND